MATLTNSGNINETILTILLEKGFQVWLDDYDDSYWAEKNGWDFNADSLEGLLGLISIYEHINPKEYKEYWWKKDIQTIDTSISLEHKDYTPIYLQKKKINAEY